MNYNIGFSKAFVHHVGILCGAMATMKYRALSVSACLFLFVAAGSANADWQYTKWGMLPEQVKAASNVTMQPNQDPKFNTDRAKTKLFAPYQSGQFSFRAGFMFDASDKLTTVNLQLADGRLCPELVAALSSAYGPPSQKSMSSVTRLYKWWDETNKNVVVFLEIGTGDCSIQYTPRAAAGAAGGL
jgi:hypothetical protein